MRANISEMKVTGELRRGKSEGEREKKHFDLYDVTKVSVNSFISFNTAIFFFNMKISRKKRKQHDAQT